MLETVLVSAVTVSKSMNLSPLSSLSPTKVTSAFANWLASITEFSFVNLKLLPILRSRLPTEAVPPSIVFPEVKNSPFKEPDKSLTETSPIEVLEFSPIETPPM